MPCPEYPYHIDVWDQVLITGRRDYSVKDLTDSYRSAVALADELAEFCRRNALGAWRHFLLDFEFARKEDAALFRLRAGDDTRVCIFSGPLP